MRSRSRVMRAPSTARMPPALASAWMRVRSASPPRRCAWPPPSRPPPGARSGRAARSAAARGAPARSGSAARSPGWRAPCRPPGAPPEGRLVRLLLDALARGRLERALELGRRLERGDAHRHERQPQILQHRPRAARPRWSRARRRVRAAPRAAAPLARMTAPVLRELGQHDGQLLQRLPQPGPARGSMVKSIRSAICAGAATR